MDKSVTMNLRVNPQVKQQAESVLKQLGVPMATAIDAYLRQISLTGGIPFPIALPKAPSEINADNMTNEQLCAAIAAGYEEMEQGKVQDAGEAFMAFRELHK
ncbi:MAG: type II toxin-antitoxin system RelB/DinJ family antitoxin [Clostridia bacterium]|nr:type II toxin-antitoxin system RelB/DinJ family antitoxin [Clostridia bacterium]NLS85998.1 type II toxin-antitoxin system RelB/DinJ family antitoxin [Oscillospiraceae bacterium]